MRKHEGVRKAGRRLSTAFAEIVTKRAPFPPFTEPSSFHQTSMNFLLIAGRAVLLSTALQAVSLSAQAATAPALGALPEIPLAQLSDRTVSPLGQAALSIRPADWKHAETPNFIYHFFQSHIATPVSVEAEFYYRVIAKELGKETAQWQRKCHIYIFEAAEEWGQFQGKGSLDPWTGGIHANGELFIQRDPKRRWKGNTLGHEVAHLVVHRFFGNGLPLWIKEGHAEYVSSRGYAAFHRARGYSARPRAQAVDPTRFMPVAQLTSAITYPRDEGQVAVFYDESERLVRFLSATDPQGFAKFFEALSVGNQFESALSKGFAGRFRSLEALEQEFKSYATKEYGTALQDQ